MAIYQTIDIMILPQEEEGLFSLEKNTLYTKNSVIILTKWKRRHYLAFTTKVTTTFD